MLPCVAVMTHDSQGGARFRCQCFGMCENRTHARDRDKLRASPSSRIDLTCAVGTLEFAIVGGTGGGYMPVSEAPRVCRIV